MAVDVTYTRATVEKLIAGQLWINSFYSAIVGKVMEWYVVGLLNARRLGKIGDRRTRPILWSYLSGMDLFAIVRLLDEISLDGGNFITASCGDLTISGMTDEGIGRRSISLSN